ncbi:hypothetical protein ACP70R_008002 [Stipagrostis hirtigluma subsp. patula]
MPRLGKHLKRLLKYSRICLNCKEYYDWCWLITKERHVHPLTKKLP